MERELNDQEKVRRQKMEDLRAKGIDPFGQAFERTANSKSIRDEFGEVSKEELEAKNVEVKIAGRIMSKRRMGKMCFMHVLDKDGHAVIVTVAEIIALTVISWKQDRQKFVGNVNNNLIVWLLEDLHAVDIPSERIVVDDRIRQFLQAYIIVVFHSAGPQTNCRF